MYVGHFGLRSRPFRTSPDVDAWYPATTHESALAGIQQALGYDEGLILLYGESGTGKTLLAHRFLANLPENSRSVFLTHGSFPDRSSLLQAIL
ncbi:MAG: AAA family ATPase, partial [Planctomycetes bacterium]|nr:AAA family ATPase [Planctomycetota bacterium]